MKLIMVSFLQPLVLIIFFHGTNHVLLIPKKFQGLWFSTFNGETLSISDSSYTVLGNQTSSDPFPIKGSKIVPDLITIISSDLVEIKSRLKDHGRSGGPLYQCMRLQYSTIVTLDVIINIHTASEHLDCSAIVLIASKRKSYYEFVLTKRFLQPVHYTFKKCMALKLSDPSEILASSYSNFMSPSNCAHYCTVKGGGLFLMFQDNCLCFINPWPHIFKKETEVSREKCNLVCTGDTSKTCGGNHQFNLYTFSQYIIAPVDADLRPDLFIGCYLPDWTGKYQIMNTSSPYTCLQSCASQGYLYGQILLATKCLCSNSFGHGRKAPTNIVCLNDICTKNNCKQPFIPVYQMLPLFAKRTICDKLPKNFQGHWNIPYQNASLEIGPNSYYAKQPHVNDHVKKTNRFPFILFKTVGFEYINCVSESIVNIHTLTRCKKNPLQVLLTCMTLKLSPEKLFVDILAYSVIQNKKDIKHSQINIDCASLYTGKKVSVMDTLLSRAQVDTIKFHHELLMSDDIPPDDNGINPQDSRRFVQYLGCAINDGVSFPFGAASYFAYHMSWLVCARLCIAKGMAVFTLHGSSCICDFHPPPRSEADNACWNILNDEGLCKEEECKCSTGHALPFGSRFRCGKRCTRFPLFRISRPDNEKKNDKNNLDDFKIFLGCFAYSDIENHSKDFTATSYMTKDWCFYQCFTWEMPYAALTNGSTCGCYDNIQLNNRINDSVCSLTCSSDWGDLCGGEASRAIYSVANSLQFKLPGKELIPETAVELEERASQKIVLKAAQEVIAGNETEFKEGKKTYMDAGMEIKKQKEDIDRETKDVFDYEDDVYNTQGKSNDACLQFHQSINYDVNDKFRHISCDDFGSDSWTNFVFIDYEFYPATKSNMKATDIQVLEEILLKPNKPGASMSKSGKKKYVERSMLNGTALMTTPIPKSNVLLEFGHEGLDSGMKVEKIDNSNGNEAIKTSLPKVSTVTPFHINVNHMKFENLIPNEQIEEEINKKKLKQDIQENNPVHQVITVAQNLPGKEVVLNWSSGSKENFPNKNNITTESVTRTDLTTPIIIIENLLGPTLPTEKTTPVTTVEVEDLKKNIMPGTAQEELPEEINVLEHESVFQNHVNPKSLVQVPLKGIEREMFSMQDLEHITDNLQAEEDEFNKLKGNDYEGENSSHGKVYVGNSNSSIGNGYEEVSNDVFYGEHDNHGDYYNEELDRAGKYIHYSEKDVKPKIKRRLEFEHKRYSNENQKTMRNNSKNSNEIQNKAMHQKLIIMNYVMSRKKRELATNLSELKQSTYKQYRNLVTPEIIVTTIMPNAIGYTDKEKIVHDLEHTYEGKPVPEEIDTFIKQKNSSDTVEIYNETAKDIKVTEYIRNTTQNMVQREEIQIVTNLPTPYNKTENMVEKEEIQTITSPSTSTTVGFLTKPPKVPKKEKYRVKSEKEGIFEVTTILPKRKRKTSKPHKPTEKPLKTLKTPKVINADYEIDQSGFEDPTSENQLDELTPIKDPPKSVKSVLLKQSKRLIKLGSYAMADGSDAEDRKMVQPNRWLRATARQNIQNEKRKLKERQEIGFKKTGKKSVLLKEILKQKKLGDVQRRSTDDEEKVGFLVKASRIYPNTNDYEMGFDGGESDIDSFVSNLKMKNKTEYVDGPDIPNNTTLGLTKSTSSFGQPMAKHGKLEMERKSKKLSKSKTWPMAKHGKLEMESNPKKLLKSKNLNKGNKTKLLKLTHSKNTTKHYNNNDNKHTTIGYKIINADYIEDIDTLADKPDTDVEIPAPNASPNQNSLLKNMDEGAKKRSQRAHTIQYNKYTDNDIRVSGMAHKVKASYGKFNSENVLYHIRNKRHVPVNSGETFKTHQPYKDINEKFRRQLRTLANINEDAVPYGEECRQRRARDLICHCTKPKELREYSNPQITWTRGNNLPIANSRAEVEDGILKITEVETGDTGLYTCEIVDKDDKTKHEKRRHFVIIFIIPEMTCKVQAMYITDDCADEVLEKKKEEMVTQICHHKICKASSIKYECYETETMSSVGEFETWFDIDLKVPEGFTVPQKSDLLLEIKLRTKELKKVSKHFAFPFFTGEMKKSKVLKFISFNYNSSVISECPSGFIKDGITCVPCLSGSYATKKDASCRLCPLNTYQNEFGMKECNPCPAGTNTTKVGAKEVLNCTDPNKVVHMEIAATPNDLGMIIGGVAGGFILVCCLVFLLSKRKKKSKKQDEDVTKALLVGVASAIKEKQSAEFIHSALRAGKKDTKSKGSGSRRSHRSGSRKRRQSETTRRYSRQKNIPENEMTNQSVDPYNVNVDDSNDDAQHPEIIAVHGNMEPEDEPPHGEILNYNINQKFNFDQDPYLHQGYSKHPGGMPYPEHNQPLQYFETPELAYEHKQDLQHQNQNIHLGLGRDPTLVYQQVIPELTPYQVPGNQSQEDKFLPYGNNVNNHSYYASTSWKDDTVTGYPDFMVDNGYPCDYNHDYFKRDDNQQEDDTRQYRSQQTQCRNELHRYCPQCLSPYKRYCIKNMSIEHNPERRFKKDYLPIGPAFQDLRYK